MDIIGSYTWVDNVLVDGMDYFAGMFGYFQSIAWALAMLVLWLGLMINAIKLVFGSESIKKVAIGTLGKLCMFLILFYSYARITGAVAHSALKWGTHSGGGHSTATGNLVGLMEQCERDLQVAQSLAKLSPKEKENRIKSMKKDVREKKALGKGEDGNFFSDMTNSDGMNSFANQANLYRDPEEVVAYQLRTMETLKEVLSPTQVKDKNGNMIDTYFLATTLYDKRGNPTNYISPASFFKISILTGELIIRRQIDYMTVKYGEIRDECVAAGWVKKDMADVIATFQVYFNLSNLLNLLLCFICMVAVIFCAIFAMIQYMMTMFEYAIVTSIVIFYVPFYLADISKSIASKLFPIFWNFFIKLMVVTILMWFAIYQYINLASDQVSMAIPFSPTVFATTMFTILLSFIVTQNGPKVAQTIISGNPELSMGEFLQAGGTMLAGGAVMGKPVQAGARAAAGGAAKAIGAGFASRAEAKAEDKGVLGQMTSFVGGSIRQGTASILRTPFSIAGSVASKVLFGGKSPDLAGKMAEGFTNTMSLHTGNASGEDGGGKESSSFDNKASGEKKENASKFNGNSSQGASPSSKAPGGVSNAAKFKSRKFKSRKSKSRKKRRRR